MKLEMETYPEKKLVELALKVTSSCHLECGHTLDELFIPSCCSDRKYIQRIRRNLAMKSVCSMHNKCYTLVKI